MIAKNTFSTSYQARSDSHSNAAEKTFVDRRNKASFERHLSGSMSHDHKMGKDVYTTFSETTLFVHSGSKIVSTEPFYMGSAASDQFSCRDEHNVQSDMAGTIRAVSLLPISIQSSNGKPLLVKISDSCSAEMARKSMDLFKTVQHNADASSRSTASRGVASRNGGGVDIVNPEVKGTLKHSDRNVTVFLYNKEISLYIRDYSTLGVDLDRYVKDVVNRLKANHAISKVIVNGKRYSDKV